MKKFIAIFLVATLVVLAISLTACNGKPLFTAEDMLHVCDTSATITYLGETHHSHHTIKIDADVYAVAIHHIDGDEVTVDYVDHSRATVTAVCTSGIDSSKLTITQTLKGTIMVTNRLYMVIGIPNSWTSYNIIADIDTGALFIEDSKATAIQAEVYTGAVNVSVQNATKVDIEVNTGAVNLTGKSEYVTIATDTGAINVDVQATKLFLSTDTGAIDFTVSNNTTINLESDTGAVHGIIHADKTQYSIFVDVGTGSCNVKNQTGTGANVLNIDIDTGSANITFKN